MGFAKPCLVCGVLTRQGSRCAKHQAEIDAKVNARKAQREHYKGDYRQRAKLVRETATHCWLCGDGHRANDPFTADHVVPGNPESPLFPAHKSCNSRRGNKPLV